MREIWKFAVPVDDPVAIKMPKGARLLTVQAQGSEMCIWAEVNPKGAPEKRYFAIFGTGNPMPSGMGYSDVYVGTVQIGRFVWHLYEITGV